jgi:hypothetical protein
MAEIPTGFPPDDELVPKVPVAAVCRIAGVAPTYFYAEARRGRAPKSKNGLTLDEAKAWLDGRIAKKVLRAEAIKRLHALYVAPADVAGTSPTIDRGSAARIGTSTLRSAAYHEAGHAVALLHAGIPVESVEIGLAGPLEGNIAGHAVFLEDPGVYEYDLAVAYLAGPYAEARQRRMHRRDALALCGAGSDLAKLQDIIGEQVAKGNVDEDDDGAGSTVWKKVESETGLLLRHNWSAVERVAWALLEHGRLDGEEVERLVAAPAASVGPNTRVEEGPANG